MTGFIEDLSEFKPIQGENAKIANNTNIPVSGKGTITLKALTSDWRASDITLSDALLVPYFWKTILFSWEIAREKDFESFLKGNNCFIKNKKCNKTKCGCKYCKNKIKK